METEKPEENKKKTELTDLEWESRVLCPDGNCIGVIGQDGRCSECGKKYDVVLAENPLPEKESFPPEDLTPDKEDLSSDEEPIQDPSDSENSDDWQDRLLCSDGNCIGVIGADGRCKECGKPYGEK